MPQLVHLVLSDPGQVDDVVPPPEGSPQTARIITARRKK